MDKATVKKAMEATSTLLSSIQIPVALVEQVGIPIVTAINNLSIGLRALEEGPVINMAPEEKGEAEDGNTDAG